MRGAPCVGYASPVLRAAGRAPAGPGRGGRPRPQALPALRGPDPVPGPGPQPAGVRLLGRRERGRTQPGRLPRAQPRRGPAPRGQLRTRTVPETGVRGSIAVGPDIRTIRALLTPIPPQRSTGRRRCRAGRPPAPPLARGGGRLPPGHDLFVAFLDARLGGGARPPAAAPAASITPAGMLKGEIDLVKLELPAYAVAGLVVDRFVVRAEHVRIIPGLPPTLAAGPGRAPGRGVPGQRRPLDQGPPPAVPPPAHRRGRGHHHRASAASG